MPESQSLNVEWLSPDTLTPYDKNPRVISQDAIEKVAASIKTFGWRQPIVVDKDMVVVVGHTRLRAARHLELESVPVHIAQDMTPEEARAYRLADNRTGEFTAWDDSLLRLEIGELKEISFDLEPIGFSLQDLQELNLVDQPSESPEGKGDLLELINVTIEEPRHKVALGDHYRVGKHHLLCVRVMTDWDRWAPLLEDGAIFCPYPGPFVPYGEKADDHTLVMVQPDAYTAGHLLDRFEEIHGAPERVA